MATIREKGPAQWHVQVRRKGWPTQTKTFTTKKDAEAWARAVEGQMDRGHYVDRSPAEKTTLREVVERYLVEVTDKRPGVASRIAERKRLERFLREEADLCAHALAHLTPDHFEAYRDRRLTQTASRGQQGGRGQYRPEEPRGPKLRKDGQPRANAAKPKAPPKPPGTIQPGTVKRELTILKRVIDHSKRRLGLAINPVNAEDVKRPVVSDERDVRLSHEEFERLLDACHESRNPWLAALVELAFETGARRGSLLRLRWDDVDLRERSALLRAVKNSRSPHERLDQAVGLSPRAVEILEGLARSLDGRVFPTTVDALKNAFNRARARAGLEHFNLHDTRHERASSLIEAGWSDSAVMAQTGHRDPKSLKRYVNLRKGHLADALAALPPRQKRQRNP
ncbi:site-specific integrase [Azospirillum thermophilum]|nr:site-specific integrase [Azospirillum thermophilum]